jgi:type I restriction enzyme R subunit
VENGALTLFTATCTRARARRKRTEAEKLRALIEGKLELMVKLNKARMDFLEKFQKLIAEYNAGSKNIEELFAELIRFS